MIAKGKQNLLKTVRQRRYLNKDFQSLRADLFEYARTYYADRINDFFRSKHGWSLARLRRVCWRCDIILS